MVRRALGMSALFVLVSIAGGQAQEPDTKGCTSSGGFLAQPHRRCRLREELGRIRNILQECDHVGKVAGRCKN